MAFFKQEFDEIKESNNPVIINDFIIKLSENPNKDHIKYLNYFIDNLNTQIHDKVKLNLIYALGETGNLTLIEEKYLNFLHETYHHSDRWVRNEIIQAIDKISKKSKLTEKIIVLIGNVLNDDYTPIKINALKVLLNLTQIPDLIFKNIFRVLNSRDSAVSEGCRRILEQFDKHKLFDLLNQLENYKILKPRAIRSLLLVQFKSILNLESFREMILNSNWDDSYRMNYLKEIDTFQRIIAKNL
ncbi:hypothetical protein LCGC14_1557630 [marine sediment metagenome]|uniref:Condensin complex subunit 1 C-terminal domain-containing protein n=1 Tax=marine sediment metagenome TaxID=412755 RepID=A0A0F9L4S4_9ZZZZ|nr:MAG: hypothetical protein Lokiarch_38680 [Candidatus Lokiarchaeum sp. GC14_75]